MSEISDVDFRSLFESVPGLYLVLDPELVIVGVTNAYLSATMTERAQIMNRHIFDVFPDNPDDPNATGTGNLRASLERVRRNKQTDAMAVQKYDIRRPESAGGGFEIRYWSPVNAPVCDRSGRLIYIVHQVEDVTEFVKLKNLGDEQSKLNDELRSRAGQMEVDIYRRAQELQEANRQLRMAEETVRKSNQDLERRVNERMEQIKQVEAQMRQLQKMDAIGTLAGGLAHDFNNILGAISMYCDLLENRSRDPEKVREGATEIQQITMRGAALTRQLLIFSRKQMVQLRSVEINDLINVLLKMLNRLIGENVQIVTKLAPDLAAIKIDPSQFEQIVMNLVVNARDAMPSGGVVKIETANIFLNEDFTSTHLAVRPGPHVVLSVSDTGCGMSPEVQAHLFEPFFTTKPVGKGTGLGLSTAYGIVKQSNGTIWVYSEINKGTVFKIYFPAVEKEVAPTLHEKLAQVSSSGGELVLLVEDEEKLRALYSEALRRFGYNVITASNGEEALVALRESGSKVSLLLTDVVMPKMSGIELAKRANLARPAGEELRVLYMSGYANDPSGERFEFDDSKVAFLQKPFDTGTLIAKIRDVLA